MSKQTAVEWLYNTIDDEIVNYLYGEINLNELSIAMLKLKEQAKAMEQEQIVDALKYSYKRDYFTPNFREQQELFEQYYNETYGGDK